RIVGALHAAEPEEQRDHLGRVEYEAGRLATGASVLDRHEAGPIAPVTAALAVVTHPIGVQPGTIGARRNQMRQDAAVERRFHRSGPIEVNAERQAVAIEA